MSAIKRLLVPGLAVVILSGCGSSGSDPAPVVPPPPGPATTDYTTFVKAQFANTADTSDPVAVEDTEFDFADNDDPTAFDDLLQ